MNFKQLLIDLQHVRLRSLKKMEIVSLIEEMLENIDAADCELRENLIYPTFVKIFEEDILSQNQYINLIDVLLSKAHLFKALDATENTAPNDVFMRSYSALVITEIIKKDASNPFFDDEQYSFILEKVMQYIEQENDTRAYDDKNNKIATMQHASFLLSALASHPRATGIDWIKILLGIKTCILKPNMLYDLIIKDFALVSISCLDNGMEEAKLLSWLETLSKEAQSNCETKEKFVKNISTYINVLQFNKSLYFCLRFNSQKLRLRAEIAEIIKNLYAAIDNKY